MLNHQRQYVNRHGMFPQPYTLPSMSQYEFAQIDNGLGAYRPDVQQSMYAREDYTHLAPPPPPLLPTQHSSALAPSYPTQASFRPLENNIIQRSRQIQQPVYLAASNVSKIMDEEQLAQMQQLSAGFEPEVKGPLVSELQAIDILVKEYANADPTYRSKTLALAASYTNIRTVRGDGKCGWRAIAFGYFERLLAARDPGLLLQEETRLRSLSNIVRQSGMNVEIYDDFASETFTLMRELGDALRHGPADAMLLERFNDDSIQNYVITQLKSLTAAWLKTHFEDFSSFILHEELHDYCEQNILPVKAEIDQIGLMALMDLLLAPAGIGLEIEYLDLSAGQAGTLHRFTRPHQAVHLGVQRLLYKPGHYDILYKHDDITGPTVQAFFQMSTRTHDDHIAPLGKPDFMHLIPGMSIVPQLPHGWQSSGFDDLFTPQSSLPAPQPTMQLPILAPKGRVVPIQEPSYSAPPAQMIVQPDPYTDSYLLDPLAMRKVSAQQHELDKHYRLSRWHHEQGNSTVQTQRQRHTQAQSTQLQTAQFRNSHYNTAHFNNPEFQPETWSPDSDERKALNESFDQIARCNRIRHPRS